MGPSVLELNFNPTSTAFGSLNKRVAGVSSGANIVITGGAAAVVNDHV
jgi:hypothetical protein